MLMLLVLFSAQAQSDCNEAYSQCLMDGPLEWYPDADAVQDCVNAQLPHCASTPTCAADLRRPVIVGEPPPPAPDVLVIADAVQPVWTCLMGELSMQLALRLDYYACPVPIAPLDIDLPPLDGGKEEPVRDKTSGEEPIYPGMPPAIPGCGFELLTIETSLYGEPWDIHVGTATTPGGPMELSTDLYLPNADDSALEPAVIVEELNFGWTTVSDEVFIGEWPNPYRLETAAACWNVHAWVTGWGTQLAVGSIVVDLPEPPTLVECPAAVETGDDSVLRR